MHAVGAPAPLLWGGLMPTPTGKTTRTERLAQPLAPEVADAMDAARLRVLAA